MKIQITPALTFPIALFAFQVLLLGLFAGYVDYERTTVSTNSTNLASTAPNFYTSFQDVHVMIFIGFGFLMTFLKKYGYGAVSYNLLISCVTIQWATLLNAWMKQRVMKDGGVGEWKDKDPAKITVGYQELMGADFTAAAVLITFGALLGKASRLQLLIICIFECIFFCINSTIISGFMGISDAGGSIVIHEFGAYFGLAIAFVIGNYGKDHELETSNYNSDLFAMIGSVFLWIFWPSFNSGSLGDDPDRQRRAIVNTYFALAASVVTAFVVSAAVNNKFKLDMVHVQNSTLAGGVAVGTAADLMLKPWGAIFIGMIAGIISVSGYTYVTPFVRKKFKIHDTCGVNNLHGMPAIFAGICAAVAATAINVNSYPNSDYKNIYPRGRSPSSQGAIQFAAVIVCFIIAVVSGLITGAAVKRLNVPPDALFNDTAEWIVPDEEIQGGANVSCNMENGNVVITNVAV